VHTCECVGKYRCAPCQIDVKRARLAAARRVRRAATPAETRAANLWKNYRLRPHQYDALRAAQDYRCAGCGIHERDVDTSKYGGRRRADGSRTEPAPLVVDHVAGTLVVRGLLCNECNLAAGKLGHNAARAAGLAAYLARQSAAPIIDLMTSDGAS
jgi:hypothetical protein